MFYFVDLKSIMASIAGHTDIEPYQKMNENLLTETTNLNKPKTVHELPLQSFHFSYGSEPHRWCNG